MIPPMILAFSFQTIVTLWPVVQEPALSTRSVGIPGDRAGRLLVLVLAVSDRGSPTHTGPGP